MPPSARRYQCAHCHCSVIICRRCDRGNTYCSGSCADIARSQSQSRARKKYQRSRAGRHNNAQRQSRFRQRQRKKVTYQGSTTHAASDLLPKAKNTANIIKKPVPSSETSPDHCHFCGCECSPFVRRDFIRHRSRLS